VAPFAADHDESGALQDPQVLHDGAAIKSPCEALTKLPRGAGGFLQQVENSPPPPIRERLEEQIIRIP
jgi:hypothetical protein